jgi:26S proteasome regulatory subunit N6
MAQQDLPPNNAARIAEAKKQTKDQPKQAEETYKSILEQGPGKTDVAARDYENALMGLGELYRDQRRTNDLAELVQQIKAVLSLLAKAKTAKLGVYSSCFVHFSSSNTIML